MKTVFTLVAAGALATAVQPMQAQQKIPVLDLAPASSRSSETLGAILGVRQLPGGKLLVNDAGKRRVMVFDSTLASAAVIIDSTAGVSNYYGPGPSPLIAYLGDSSLFVDVPSQSLVVIDPNGKISRTMSAPRPGDLRFLRGGSSGIDHKGRLLYLGPLMQTMVRDGPAPAPGAAPPVSQPPDSAPLLRADFDTRTVDTAGRVKRQSGTRMSATQGPNGQMKMKATVNPLSTVDEWAVLSDGSIAFVRGQDYHIDWIDPDGTARSTGKLPFDWKRLTDEDKQALIDSARTAQTTAQAAAAKAAAEGKPLDGMHGARALPGAAGAGAMVIEMRVAGGGGGAGGAGMPMPPPPGMNTGFSMVPEIDYVPIKEIADYYPPIRSGAAKADLDGNLWILPTTSAQSAGGELVYDVVNRKGELFQRVRIPAGRQLVGFGLGGVVYLAAGDLTAGFNVERTTLIGGVKSAQ